MLVTAPAPAPALTMMPVEGTAAPFHVTVKVLLLPTFKVTAISRSGKPETLTVTVPFQVMTPFEATVAKVLGSNPTCTRLPPAFAENKPSTPFVADSVLQFALTPLPMQ